MSKKPAKKAPKKAPKGKPAPKKPAKKKPQAKKAPERKPKKTKAQAKPRAKAPPRAKKETKPRSATGASAAEVRSLLEGAEMLQDLAPGTTLHARKPPDDVAYRTPWDLLCRFAMPAGSTYNDVLDILVTWRDDRKVEKKIGKRRWSRMQVQYQTDRGKDGEYSIAETGPWELTISRAVERVGVRDERDAPLVERYGADTKHQSIIRAILVWLSHFNFKEVS